MSYVKCVPVNQMFTVLAKIVHFSSRFVNSEKLNFFLKVMIRKAFVERRYFSNVNGVSRRILHFCKDIRICFLDGVFS